MATGNYAAVERRAEPGEVIKGRTALGDAETLNSVERSRYVVIGPQVNVDNWCLSKFDTETPVNVAKAHSVRDIDRIRMDKAWRGSTIVLVPGWSRGGLVTEVTAFLLAGIDGMGG